jgi:hypothetical protein
VWLKVRRKPRNKFLANSPRAGCEGETVNKSETRWAFTMKGKRKGAGEEHLEVFHIHPLELLSPSLT